MKSNKMSTLQCLLTICFVTAHITSNILTAKPIALPFGFSTTCGAFVFPVTYIISDVFSEVYGYRFSRMTCYISFAATLAVSILVVVAIATPAPEWWNSQDAFAEVLGNTPRVLVASLLAFALGDFANDKLFDTLKEKSKCSFATRAVVSSFLGQMVDSMVFIPVVFAGIMPLVEMVKMMTIEVVVKTAFEAAVVPLTAMVVKRVVSYESR